jgi:hypothetical protein
MTLADTREIDALMEGIVHSVSAATQRPLEASS